MEDAIGIIILIINVGLVAGFGLMILIKDVAPRMAPSMSKLRGWFSSLGPAPDLSTSSFFLWWRRQRAPSP